MAYAQNVPAAERTLDLLETLAAAPDGLSAGELIETLRISRSSLFALLNTLKARNYIEQNDERGRYRAGPALYTLTPAPQRELAALLDAFQTDPELSLLNETIALARLDGPDTIIIARQESHHPVRVVLDIGQRRPAHATAAGLILLAGLPPGAIERHLAGVRSADFNPLPLSQVQQEGQAQTQYDDIIEAAYPICPDGYQPTIALLIAAPAFRWTSSNNLSSSFRAAAARLSYRLGAPVYRPYGQTAALVGPTTPLETGEINAFLRQAWGARLACIRTDGTPHVVPLWYEWDGQFFWITASSRASWGHYVCANAEVSLTIDEPWPPLRRVLVIGSAAPVATDVIEGGVAALRARLEIRYLGRVASTVSPEQIGWQAFRLTPKKIIGQRGLGQ